MAKSTRTKPFCTLLRRRNVDGAVWRNRDSNGSPFYVASVNRSYKLADGTWKNETLYVPLDDIPRVIAVLQEAEQKMYEAIDEDYKASRDDAAA